MTSALPVTSVYRGCIRRLPAHGPDHFRMSLTRRGVPRRLMGTRLRLFLTPILSYNAAANNTARWLTCPGREGEWGPGPRIKR